MSIAYCLSVFVVDSTNQTVIINESTSSDGSAAAQLRQRAVQLAAVSATPQPIITSTSSAPDVFYTEPRLPGVGAYHDDDGMAAEVGHHSKSSGVRFEEGGESTLPAGQNWAIASNGQEMIVQSRVPAYRPAPDYDSVMQQRLLSQYYPSYVHPYLGPDCTSFSQPDIYQHSAMVGQWNVGGAGMPAMTVQGGHVVDRAGSLVIQPEAVGVVRHASAAGSIMPRAGQYLYYRVPPPYPRQSSSTPDLASPTKHGLIVAHGGGVDPQPRYLMHGAVQSQFDESLENIAAEVQQLQVYDSRSVDPSYHLSSADNCALQLGQSGVAIHPGNIMSPSAAGYYGHSTLNAGVRIDHRIGEANRLDYLQFDEYAILF